MSTNYEVPHCATSSILPSPHPTGPLVAIFQHELTFLQSESLQTHVGTIYRRAIGPLAHHNSTSAYSPSLTCTSPDDRLSSPSRYKLTCFSNNFPIRTKSSNKPKSVINCLVTMEPNYSLFTSLRDNGLRPSSIVASLRRRNNVVLSQGWANFFVGGPNEKSKISGGPT
jgi:hypothetical protein